MLKAIKKAIPEPVKNSLREMRHELPRMIRSMTRGDTSQFGEVSALLPAIGADWPQSVVDVGAYDGKHFSNSYPFIKRGWSALLVEPDPENFAACSRVHAGNAKVKIVQVGCSDKPGRLNVVRGTANEEGGLFSAIEQKGAGVAKHLGQVIAEVDILPLTDLLAREGWPADFGVLSVDAEGLDYEVLLGCDPKRFLPRAVITEDWNPDPAKEAAKQALLKERGYVFYRHVGCNTLWVHGKYHRA